MIQSQLSYSEGNITQARSALERLYTALRDVVADRNVDMQTDDYLARFNKAMDDDFNTPEAMAVLFDLSREINKAKAEGESGAERATKLAGILLKLGQVLGILQSNPNEYLQGDEQGSDESAQVEALIKARNDARSAKDWPAADAARDALNALNIVLEDGPNGTTWRKG